MQKACVHTHTHTHTHRASQVARVVKNPPVNAGDARDTVSIPGSGRSPGVGSGIPFQHSCLENLMGREAWCVTVHGAAELDRTQLLSTCTYIHLYTIYCKYTNATYFVCCVYMRRGWVEGRGSYCLARQMPQGRPSHFLQAMQGDSPQMGVERLTPGG